MIIVTGGAGFIGSNLVKALNEQGRDDIIVIDDLTDGHKFVNLVDCDISDYFDKDDFIASVTSGDLSLPNIDAVYHLGACSDTTEWDGQYIMANNYEYSKQLLAFCLDYDIPFIYASSAATYGAGSVFKEERQYEKPLNLYGYSKFLFDQYVRSILPEIDTQVVGLRYFNVYGPREQHKGSMPSMAFHFNNQIQQEGEARLFVGTDGYGDGEQRRDFISVEDVVAVNLWFYEHPEESGIFNVGTGRSQTFNEVANAVIEWHGYGKKRYIPFPEHLKGHYQSCTEADISALREAGYTAPFKTVEEGVKAYLDAVNESSASKANREEKVAEPA